MRTAVAALTTLVATACGTHAAVDVGAGNPKGYIGGSGAAQVVPTGQRTAVRDLTGSTLTGGSFRLDAYRGRVVVVNFWSSSCPPCRAEADAVDAVYRATSSAGVVFVGVDFRDDRAEADAFVHTHHVPYPSVYDEPGLATLDFPGIPPSAIPTTVVIDRSGREAAVVTGAVTYDGLLALVRTVEGERSA